jgi:hypothetical protein
MVRETDLEDQSPSSCAPHDAHIVVICHRPPLVLG